MPSARSASGDEEASPELSPQLSSAASTKMRGGVRRSQRQLRSDSSSGADMDDMVPLPPPASVNDTEDADTGSSTGVESTDPPGQRSHRGNSGPASRRGSSASDESHQGSIEQVGGADEAGDEPARKSSAFRGICWDRQISKWRAETWYDGRKRFLGNFTDERRAADAYDAAARRWHGRQAKLNFPKAGEVGNDTTSTYRGVCWDSRRHKWEAKIWHAGKKHHCGYHSDEEAAALAYDAAARRLKGANSAIVNFAAPAEDAPARKSTRTRKGISVAVAPEEEAPDGNLPSPAKRGRSSAGSGKADAAANAAFVAAASRTEAPGSTAAARSARGGTSAGGNGGGTRPRTSGKSSRFRGVTWSRARRKWLAQIRISGKLHHVGHFVSEEEAAHAFDAAALRLRGPSATFNFPELVPADAVGPANPPTSRASASRARTRKGRARPTARRAASRRNSGVRASTRQSATAAAAQAEAEAAAAVEAVAPAPVAVAPPPPPRRDERRRRRSHSRGHHRHRRASAGGMGSDSGSEYYSSDSADSLENFDVRQFVPRHQSHGHRFDARVAQPAAVGFYGHSGYRYESPHARSIGVPPELRISNDLAVAAALIALGTP